MSLTRANLCWLIAYLTAMTALVAALAVTRQRVVAKLDTPEARRQWQVWKEQTAQQQKESGSAVQRRPVMSDEPPALILLRDRFPAIVASSVLIGSFLFAFFSFVARGAFRHGRPPP